MVKNLASVARGTDVTAGFNTNSINNASHGVCIGDSVISRSSDNVVIGAFSEASYSGPAEYGRSTVIGTHSNSLGAYSTVVGADSSTQVDKQIVLGYNSKASNTYKQIIIGSDINKVYGSEEGTYISPIREDNTLIGNNYVVTYNTDTKELKHTAINLNTSGAPQQGLQSVTDIDNTTTNEIVIAQGSNELHCVDTHIQMINDNNAVCIGPTAHGAYNNSASRSRVAIGSSAGQNNQGEGTVAIGPSACPSDQGNHAVAIGDTAGGRDGMGPGAIAIGFETGTTAGVQPIGSICIGSHAQTQVGADHAIAIGQGTNVTGSNSIALGYGVSATNPDAFYVSPVRAADTTNDTDAMILVRKSNEIMEYDSVQTFIGNITANLQLYTNQEIAQNIQYPVYLIDDHRQNQLEGLSLNGYNVHTIANSDTYTLPNPNSDNDLYGRVFHVKNNETANIVLPPSNVTVPGMNFIITRGSGATVNVTVPTDVDIIHTDTIATGSVVFDSSMQTNMIKLIAVSNEQWIMQ